MRRASLAKIQVIEEMTWKELRSYKWSSLLRRQFLFLLFAAYLFAKGVCFFIHITESSEESVYEEALQSIYGE